MTGKFAVLITAGFSFFLSVSYGSSPQPSGKKEISWPVFLPAILYQPETGMTLAGAVLWDYVPETTSENLPKNRNLKVTSKLSQKKQVEFSLEWEHDFSSGFGFNIQSEWKKWPDLIFRPGQESPLSSGEEYVPQTKELLLTGKGRNWNHLRPEVHLHFHDYQILEMEDGGWLEKRPDEKDNGLFSGLGIGFTLDSRNQLYFPSQGWFNRTGTYFYDPVFGSQSRFQIIESDFRWFFPAYEQSVLAFQGLVRGSWGRVPISFLSYAGGKDLIRGVFEGRFRDNHMLAIQGEWRIPLFWRVGVNVFFGSAKVLPSLANWSNGWASGAGMGGRFRLSKTKPLHARGDIAIGEQGWKIYITLLEAF